MLSVLRRAVAAAVLVGATAVTAEAQMGGMKVEEISITMVNLSSNDGGSTFGLNFPGGLSLGLYLNDKIALEPTLGFNSVSPDGADSFSVITIGTLVPYYLGTDRGMTGLYIAPGFWMTKATDVDAVTSVGVDVGFKKNWKPNVSWRFSAGMRSTDGESTIVAGAGVSIFRR
jgi:hypothetical protein